MEIIVALLDVNVEAYARGREILFNYVDRNHGMTQEPWHADDVKHHAAILERFLSIYRKLAVETIADHVSEGAFRYRFD